jgi:hypothetical protein
VTLPNAEPPDTTTPLLTTRLAWAPTAELASLDFVRRVVGANPHGIGMMASVLEERLVFGSAARFEVLFGFRYREDGIRTLFST